jgi:DEAD/DEAH box helicase domain-containing protein
MSVAQSVDEIWQAIRQDPRFSAQITAWRLIEPIPARWADFPAEIHPDLVHALKSQGIERLYSHQAEAYRAIREGRSVVIVTPTASGKTLCYNLPVLNRLLAEPEARALYLFPTKALSQDQVAELHELTEMAGRPIRTFTYDGDTPQDARRAIRLQGNIVVSNPDMLHCGILPHHTRWVQLFSNLKYVVIDEIHSYRGIFGSHFANVLRRLKRVCSFHGSSPQFICCSATIANPDELASRLLEEEVVLIDQNGAPRGEKLLVFYNPPVVHEALGIRRSYLHEARDLASRILQSGIQTLIFATSRLSTEILVTYLKEAMERAGGDGDLVRGYRGGYLPLLRREIEAGMREGKILGVVSTNALELGIDIGRLDACVIAGYPGSIASTWQQVGRAGRRLGLSLAILVASSSPLNQFIINHPEYFWGRSPEVARINPDNPLILINHLKCAAFELPFAEGEAFGGRDPSEMLKFLEEERVVHLSGGQWHWMSDSYPADQISLRSVSSDNFLVLDASEDNRTIAEVEFTDAPSTLHEKAIYLCEGKPHLVERIDYAGTRAYVRPVEVDYYTDAITYNHLRILDVFEREDLGRSRRAHGEVHVLEQVVGFKKIKFYTLENLGSGEVLLPEQEMHTTAYWLTIPRILLEGLPLSPAEVGNGLLGLAHALRSVASLFLMSDPRDLATYIGDESVLEHPPEKPDLQALTSPSRLPPGLSLSARPDFQPSVFLYDNYPGGIGLSPQLYQIHEDLLHKSLELIQACSCRQGCPSCVGAIQEVGRGAKSATLSILRGTLGVTT